ncbi:neuritin 1-like b [Astyanax mexicanus]|uniref:neuritin 1-like b n=1 Tax=Astyanax mexicanus TaxID=7994 RepID=UPI0020CAFE0D|nr:neuritin 1-like b [Astyanax mexicanus]
MNQLLFFTLCFSVCGSALGAAITPLCSSVYRGFAECLVTLGDSVSVQSDNVQDITSICRYWDVFQDCVRGALAGCRGDAAEVWESLRAESRRTQFSGNLYEMCANRPPTPTPKPLTPPSTDQTNQESLKGLAAGSGHTHSVRLFLACISVVLIR